MRHLFLSYSSKQAPLARRLRTALQPLQDKGRIEIFHDRESIHAGDLWREALAEALGDKAGIRRYGSAKVPMEDALADVAVDLSGRAAVVFNARFPSERIGTFETQLVEEFLRRFALAAGMNLHVTVPYGSNDHHIAEAIFKALAQALRTAKSIDPDRPDQVPSTKGTL